MHNEVFNDYAIHTYYPSSLSDWTYMSRAQFPDLFVDALYSAYQKNIVDLDKRKVEERKRTKATGFKAFYDHFLEGGRPSSTFSSTFMKIMGDPDIKKVILHRENVFAVYVSSLRALKTGAFMTNDYHNLIVEVPVKAVRLSSINTMTRTCNTRGYHRAKNMI